MASDERKMILSNKFYVKSFGVVAAIFIVVAALNVTSPITTTSSSMAEVDSPQVSFANEYTSKHGHPALDYRWVKDGYLVEPHRDTFVTITVSDDIDKSKLTAECSATHKQSKQIIYGTSEKNVDCILVFTDVGDFTVDTSIRHSELGVIHSANTDVISRYVRRDIRKLSSTDLADYMNAARVMYDISLEEGIQIYGSDYKDMGYFTDTHLQNSVPDKHNDRLHDGMGFLTQHVALTNEYELGLQTINRAVALPYWDFTQDLVMIKEMAKAKGRKVDYRDLWSLDLWGPEYFGTADSTLHTVTAGRWAYTRVPKQQNEDKDFASNPYGFMRAPWNLQSSPYITRYHKACGLDLGNIDSRLSNQWPSCQEHHYAVFDISSYAYYVGYMAYVAHAGVHRMIGGAGGDCDEWTKLMNVIGPSRVKNLQEYATFLGRFTWRKDYCSEPTASSCIGTAGHGNSDKCRMMCGGCSDESFTQGQLDNYTDMFTTFADASEFQTIRMVETVFCESKVILGEHIEASSAVDVSFWPIHPTLERLLQYKQLVNPLTDYSWDGSPYFSWNAKCMWGLEFGSACEGHGEHDVTAGQTSVYDEEKATFVRKYLTNWELVELSLPKNTWKLPYVYDTFDHKDCEKEGIVFKKVPK